MAALGPSCTGRRVGGANIAPAAKNANSSQYASNISPLAAGLAIGRGNESRYVDRAQLL
jgi:hypothetical protein